ncbi:hypothetical protein Tsp_05889, partial [Trichinella spiralis]|uniref:hypothetical protein n=1 Tax=Trichinella spiralis TaxID=6334 RepID=UPI0001EFC5D6
SNQFLTLFTSDSKKHTMNLVSVSEVKNDQLKQHAACKSSSYQRIRKLSDNCSDRSNSVSVVNTTSQSIACWLIDASDFLLRMADTAVIEALRKPSKFRNLKCSRRCSGGIVEYLFSYAAACSTVLFILLILYSACDADAFLNVVHTFVRSFIFVNEIDHKQWPGVKCDDDVFIYKCKMTNICTKLFLFFKIVVSKPAANLLTTIEKPLSTCPVGDA